mmetsp:Transcript_1605/g.1982  ORF Transcript_1605/g.1982 Transcript_1605/m.1982 type:complete len:586 (+) Transcript_1605:75-1832(+)
MARAKAKKGSKKEQRDPRQEHLDTLHMEFRKMEGKKKKNNEATQNNLRMQKQQIEKLRMDNDRLKEDLALGTRQARATSSLSSSSQVDKLKDECDEFTRRIQVEQKKKSELTVKIKELDLKLREQRDKMRQMQGFGNSRDYNLRVQREIRRYESRLDKARIKYNEAQSHNNKLREQIDSLRKDRDSFDGIFKKLTKELRDKKEDVQRLIAQSNDAYKSRSEAQAEMQELKARADKEQVKFDSEWKKLGDTMMQQTDDPDEMDENGKTNSRARKNTFETLAEDTTEQELREQVAASGERIASDRKEIFLSQEKVRKFKDAFDKIEEETKISDTDELVKAFLTAEDRNFNLFNEVNDVTSKIERVAVEVEELKQEADRYKDIGAGIEMDKQRKLIMAEMEKKHKKTCDKATILEKRYEKSLKLIAQMKTGIREIFDMIECGQMESSNELLAEGVTETNMMQFLGIIEERTNDVLDAYQAAQDADDEEDEEDVNDEAEVGEGGEEDAGEAGEEGDVKDAEDGEGAKDADGGEDEKDAGPAEEGENAGAEEDAGVEAGKQEDGDAAGEENIADTGEDSENFEVVKEGSQ